MMSVVEIILSQTSDISISYKRQMVVIRKGYQAKHIRFHSVTHII